MSCLLFISYQWAAQCDSCIKPPVWGSNWALISGCCMYFWISRSWLENPPSCIIMCSLSCIVFHLITCLWLCNKLFRFRLKLQNKRTAVYCQVKNTCSITSFQSFVFLLLFCMYKLYTYLSYYQSFIHTYYKCTFSTCSFCSFINFL